MTTSNFDELIEREGYNTLKLELLKEMFGREDLLPLWIADMDFRSPQFIIDALSERLNHPILGYSALPPTYWGSILGWVKRKHNWAIHQEYRCFLSGILIGIGHVIIFFTKHV